MVCALTANVQASLSPLGGEFPLLGNVEGHQSNPRVVLGRTGGFVAWQRATTQDSTERVMVQALAADMRGAGLSRRVSNSAESHHEMRPAVAMLAEGGAVVVWESGTRNGADVRVRFLDASGNFLTSEIVVNTHVAGIQGKPAVAVVSSGEVVVAWSSAAQDGAGEGVYAQRFTGGGAKLGGEFQVHQRVAGNQSDPAVVALKEGRFLVAWVSEAAGGTAASGAVDLRGTVMGRLFNAQGAAEGAEYVLATGEIYSGVPALATAAAGGFVMAWQGRSGGDVSSLADIYVRAFGEDGQPQGPSQRHNTHLPGMQVGPALSQMGEDTLVAWTSYGQDASGGSVQGRMLSGGKEFQINTQSQLHQSSPAVAADGQNKFLAVWVNTLKADHSILSAQRYLTSEGELAGVVDVTAGPAEVVQANAPPRAITVGAVRHTPNVPTPGAMEQTVGIAMPSNAALASARAAASAVDVPMPAIPPSAARASTAGQQALIAAAQRTLTQRTAMARPAGGLAAAASSIPATRLAERSMASGSISASRNLTGGAQAQRTTSAGKAATAQSHASRVTVRESSDLARREQNTPVATTVIRTETGVLLEWHGRAGAKYQVQGSDDLSLWVNQGAVQTGTGQTLSVEANLAGGPRYYRVMRTN